MPALRAARANHAVLKALSVVESMVDERSTRSYSYPWSTQPPTARRRAAICAGVSQASTFIYPGPSWALVPFLEAKR